MDKLKKFLLIMLSVICVSCIGVALSSCGTSEEEVYYVLNEDGESYSATGIPQKIISFKRDVVIADTYNGLPVTAVQGDILAKTTFEQATSITIPSSVTSIGQYAFRGCEKIKEIVIPKSVTEIGYQAFNNCYKLKNVTIEGTAVTFGGAVFSYCKALKEFSIPKGTTKVASGMFSNCKNLTNVTLPEGITELGAGAFYYCKSLTAIDLPESLETIWQGVFDRCELLTQITFPQKLSEYVPSFKFCENLERFIVAQENEYFSAIDGVLFNRDGTELLCYPAAKEDTSYVISSDVTLIGEEAFHSCKNLKDIQIPTSVTYIGGFAFSNCENLQSIYLPQDMEYLGNYAFYDCTSLNTISLPHCKAIARQYLFFDCVNLETVICPDTMEEWNKKGIFLQPWTLRLIQKKFKTVTIYCSDGVIVSEE